MLLMTSKGKEHDAVWADVASSGALYVEIWDKRPILEIAQDFDGLKWLERKDESQGDKRFEGYGELTGVVRINDDAARVTIRKAG